MTNSKPVSIIYYWNLRFVCNLVLGVWDFIDSKSLSTNLNFFIQLIDVKAPAIITQPMQAIGFQQGRFLWQEISAGEPIKKTFNHSSMGDYQNPFPRKTLSSIHQCLTAPFKNLQTALTLKWSEIPSHSFLGFKFLHLEKISKIKACPTTPILFS